MRNNNQQGAEDINYRVTVSKLSTASSIKFAPISGLLENALISFPPGSNCLVECIIYYKTVQIFPHPPGGIALDNATVERYINRTVNKNDPLEVRLLNHDEGYEHTITVVLHIKEVGIEITPRRG